MLPCVSFSNGSQKTSKCGKNRRDTGERERAEAQKIRCWLIRWSLLIAKESTRTWLSRGWTIRKHTIWCLTLQLKNGTGSGKYNNFSAEIHGKLEDRTDILCRDTWFS